MQRICPRASAGFSRLAASISPFSFPAPMRRWSSSMKRMTLPSDFSISSRMSRILCSKFPRNAVLATSDPKSSVNSLHSFSVLATSPSRILCANPSTIAVFPTPGSPTSTGLFFVLLHRICTSLRISSSLPITGSSFPARASAIRSLEYFSSSVKLCSFLAALSLLPATDSFFGFTPASSSADLTTSSISAEYTKSSNTSTFSPFMSFTALYSKFCSFGLSDISSPCIARSLRWLASHRSKFFVTSSITSFFLSSLVTDARISRPIPFLSSSITTKRCTGVSSAFLSTFALDCARSSTSSALYVYR
mmetsp:Transcript_31203/g.70220  ORF Transcript_31203/g.70220 Transcript_31203/m.70220 type:complete len:306 (+) Transcript_31203:1808-2725(+)